MQICKRFSKVIFYFQTIVHLCEGSDKDNLPPEITSVFEAEYFVPVSYSYPFSLHCKADNGIISYQWFKNNSKIQTNDQVVVNESNGDLTFRKITKDCFGLYHCVAENQHGASVSLFVTVKEAALGVFFERTNETIKCEMFHHCKIPCTNRPNCEPSKECKIEWKIGMGTGNPVRTSKNIAIDGRGDLHFLNIKRSDEGPNYSCGIWNEKIQRFAKGTTYTVEIIESNETNELKAVWRNNPKAVLGESATLQCIFSGSPVPIIQWLNTNGSEIKPNSKYKIKQYGRELLIRNVTFDDEGEYACVANSAVPMNPYLNVTTPPMFADTGSRFMMKVIQLSHEEETEIQCNTISAPNESDAVVIQWMKNGRNINKDSLYKFLEENKKLYIPITDKGGCYTCVTENSEGIAVANFILPPKHTDQRVKYVVITVCSTAMVIVFIMGVIVLIKRERREKDVLYNNEQVNEENERSTCIEDPVYSNPLIELSENEYSSNCYEEVSFDTPERMQINDNPYTLIV